MRQGLDVPLNRALNVPRKSVLAVVLPVALALLVGGCGSTMVYTKRLRPAVVDLGDYPHVMVGAIEGDSGDVLADRIQFRMEQAGTVPMLDPRFLLGGPLGGMAMVGGDIQSIPLAEQRAENGYWTLTAHLTLIDTATGRVLLERTITRVEAREEPKSTPKHGNSLGELLLSVVVEGALSGSGAGAQVAAKLSDGVAIEFARLAAPSFESVGVPLYKTPGVNGMGIALARKGDWEGAAGSFGQELEQAESGTVKPRDLARARYNLGVALGYAGHPEEGLKELDAAIAILPEDTFLRQRDEVARMGVATPARETPASPGGIAAGVPLPVPTDLRTILPTMEKPGR
ncbi:MAG: hypothetical protein OEW11_00260 [Nitrospirota bacterium]|nr:hypothetical protein [Nitrospirota bacterium]